MISRFVVSMVNQNAISHANCCAVLGCPRLQMFPFRSSNSDLLYVAGYYLYGSTVDSLAMNRRLGFQKSVVIISLLSRS